MNSAQAPDASGQPHPSRRQRRRLQPAHEVRARRRRVVGWTIFGVSCLLMVNALVGDNGYLATLRADRESAALEDSLASVRYENQMLRSEIRRMQDDPTALEEVARREQGLIKPGETMIIVKDPSTTPAPRAR